MSPVYQDASTEKVSIRPIKDKKRTKVIQIQRHLFRASASKHEKGNPTKKGRKGKILL